MAITPRAQLTRIDRKKSFVDVPVTDDGVETTTFLDVCEELVSIFGMKNCSYFSSGLVLIFSVRPFGIACVSTCARGSEEQH